MLTCVSRHPQLRTGQFYWSKVILPACPCWRPLAYVSLFITRITQSSWNLEVNYGPQKSWLNFGSKLEHILDIVDAVPLPLLQLLGFMWNRATEDICSCNGTSPLRFLQAECPTNSIKALKQYTTTLASSVQATNLRSAKIRIGPSASRPDVIRGLNLAIFFVFILCRSKINTQKN